MASYLFSPKAGAPRIRPLRDAAAFAGAVLAVSFLALLGTYYFSRRAQIEAVRSELAQLSRVIAANIDGDLHRVAAQADMLGTPEYLKALDPIVRFHRATQDVIYVYTYFRDDAGAIRFGLDSAYLYRAPGDDEPVAKPMTVYEGSDPDARRAVESRALIVNHEPTGGHAARQYLSAYAPFYDARGVFVGVVAVDMWVRTMDQRLAGLQRIVTIGGFAIFAVALVGGFVVFRLRTATAVAVARDRQAVADLAAAKDAAEQSSRAKSAFLAVMSHELRTPLNGIIGYSELARDDLQARGDAELAADMNRVLAAGKHLTAIITDVLDYSRIEAGRLELVPGSVDLAGVLGEVVELLAPAAAEKGVALVTVVQPSLEPVWTDHTRVRQVLLNLVGNAIKFTDRGRVVVRVRAGADGQAVCTVHDTGVGIPLDKRTHLFKPFSQVDGSSTRSAGGSGLGLAICQRLVVAMGGSLVFRSCVGRGSTFRFTVPAMAK